MALPSAGGHRVCGAHHSFAAGFAGWSWLWRFPNRRFRLFLYGLRVLRFVSFAGDFPSAHRNEKRKREVDGRFYFAKSQKIGKREIDRGLWFAFSYSLLRLKAAGCEGRHLPLAPFMRGTSFLGRCPFSLRSASRQAIAEASRPCLCRTRSSRQFARSPSSLLL